MSMLRVLQIGLGPIGRAIARRVMATPGLELAGATDPAPQLAGRSVGEVLQTAALPGLVVHDDVDGALARARPDVALQATGSHLADVAPQLAGLASAGIPVVSTCEELAYPYYRHPDLCRELDAAARAGGVALLGTGVNPGFVMDKLVVTLLAVCDTVDRVWVVRVVDARTRRESFQRKIGAGMSQAVFEEGRAAGRLGHVGLAESAHMIADAMRLGPARRLSETLRPKIAAQPVESEFLRVEPGQVSGIDQTATLDVDGVERVRMELKMYLGAPRPRDAVMIEGTPPLETEVASGIPGDGATVAVAVSCAALVRDLRPGLRTMLDVPLRPPAHGGARR
jgi:4-hydroxy-tetrahydrodipicolinate reductase